jgi:mannose-P-dolichol utilization defect protein 1
MDTLFPLADQILTPLRPYLSSITHNLPSPVQDFLTSLIGPECYTHLLTNLSVSASPQCTTLLLSKLIGYGILTLSLVVKLPQLLKLLSSRSSSGISFLSYFLETAAYAITLAYNVRHANPISTYGEIAVIAAQNVVVSLLVLEFRKQRAAQGLFVAVLASAGWALFDERVVSEEHLGWLQAATIPLGMASKVPQIWTVWREKSTGQLSAFAVSGSCAEMRRKEGLLTCGVGVQLSRRFAGARVHDSGRG